MLKLIGKIVSLLFHNSNQFASGGLLLMAIGAIGAYARKVPEQIWNWIVGQFTVSVSVKDDDKVFQWIKYWFINQKFISRTRRVDLATGLVENEISLLPSPGHHWFWWNKRLFRVWYERTTGQTNTYNSKRVENFYFVLLGRSRKTLKAFLNDITRLHRQRLEDEVKMMQWEGSYWEASENYSPRSLESVVLPTGDKERLIADIKKFFEQKERYRKLGVPYHRGYLFYGPAGTGKSSLASALASHFGTSLFVINLNEFNDRTLAKAMITAEPRSIILMEDIDAMGTKIKERKSRDDEPASTDASDRMADKFGVTMSGLLNSLDGVHAPSGVIYIMTTNKEQALDPALIRPGRIDYQLHLGNATYEQKLEMYRRFFPDDSEQEAETFIMENLAVYKTMAEFQGALLSKEAGQQAQENLELVGD